MATINNLTGVLGYTLQDAQSGMYIATILSGTAVIDGAITFDEYVNKIELIPRWNDTNIELLVTFGAQAFAAAFALKVSLGQTREFPINTQIINIRAKTVDGTNVGANTAVNFELVGWRGSI